MGWFRRNLGLDFFDLAVQFTLTGLAMGFVSEMVRGPASDGVLILVPAASIALLAWRRQRGLRQLATDPTIGLTTGQMAAARIEDLESRVAQLEATEARLAELEERLDFTERMLAAADRESLPRGGNHG